MMSHLEEQVGFSHHSQSEIPATVPYARVTIRRCQDCQPLFLAAPISSAKYRLCGYSIGRRTLDIAHWGLPTVTK